jgi:hypothetical protein
MMGGLAEVGVGHHEAESSGWALSVLWCGGDAPQASVPRIVGGVTAAALLLPAVIFDNDGQVYLEDKPVTVRFTHWIVGEGPPGALSRWPAGTNVIDQRRTPTVVFLCEHVVAMEGPHVVVFQSDKFMAVRPALSRDRCGVVVLLPGRCFSSLKSLVANCARCQCIQRWCSLQCTMFR